MLLRNGSKSEGFFKKVEWLTKEVHALKGFANYAREQSVLLNEPISSPYKYPTSFKNYSKSTASNQLHLPLYDKEIRHEYHTNYKINKIFIPFCQKSTTVSWECE